jgi:hypothetical protein
MADSKGAAASAAATGSHSRECRLNRIFGDDTGLPAWTAFREHVALVRKANHMAGHPQWADAEFAAVQIRLQLRGEPEMLVLQAAAAGEPWVDDATALMEQLASRYETGQGIEVAIQNFEAAAQRDGESLEANS